MFKNKQDAQTADLAPKSRRTRGAITHAAFESFRQKGFERTTMRDIAKTAGLTVGAAYYYFGSKEEIVLEFYRSAYLEFVPLARAAIQGKPALIDRLHAVIETRLGQLQPYRESLASIMSAALDPGSALSPMHERSADIRESALQLYREVVSGSASRLPPRLSDRLPRLLWLYHLGIVAKWVRDASDGQRKTWSLIDRTESLLNAGMTFTRLPFSERFLNPFCDLLDEIFEMQDTDTGKEDV